MKFIKRLFYYLLGVGLGVIMVYFLFGDRDIQCSYFPNERVLNDLRQKEISYSGQAACVVDCLELDSIDMAGIFSMGKVNFDDSQPRIEPCGMYVVESGDPELELKAILLNCDSTVEVQWLQGVSADVCDCD
ncbi:MAG: DUF4258 domain-containing protein [Bacteroidota bacterium]|nr:DUF4258 domain-containing protein [Bacteroidota bacterium]